MHGNPFVETCNQCEEMPLYPVISCILSPERMPRIIGVGGGGGGAKNQLLPSHKFKDYEVTTIF